MSIANPSSFPSPQQQQTPQQHPTPRSNHQSKPSSSKRHSHRRSLSVSTRRESLDVMLLPAAAEKQFVKEEKEKEITAKEGRRRALEALEGKSSSPVTPGGWLATGTADKVTIPDLSDDSLHTDGLSVPQFSTSPASSPAFSSSNFDSPISASSPWLGETGGLGEIVEEEEDEEEEGAEPREKKVAPQLVLPPRLGVGGGISPRFPSASGFGRYPSSPLAKEQHSRIEDEKRRFSGFSFAKPRSESASLYSTPSSQSPAPLLSTPPTPPPPPPAVAWTVPSLPPAPQIPTPPQTSSGKTPLSEGARFRGFSFPKGPVQSQPVPPLDQFQDLQLSSLDEEEETPNPSSSTFTSPVFPRVPQSASSPSITEQVASPPTPQSKRTLRPLTLTSPPAHIPWGSQSIPSSQRSNLRPLSLSMTGASPPPAQHRESPRALGGSISSNASGASSFASPPDPYSKHIGLGWGRSKPPSASVSSNGTSVSDRSDSLSSSLSSLNFTGGAGFSSPQPPASQLPSSLTRNGSFSSARFGVSPSLSNGTSLKRGSMGITAIGSDPFLFSSTEEQAGPSVSEGEEETDKTKKELVEEIERLRSERDSLAEDVDGWKERCKAMEDKLKDEKRIAGVERDLARERIRKLGDRLAASDGASASAATSSATANDLAVAQTRLINEMRDQVFSLASALARSEEARKSAEDILLEERNLQERRIAERIDEDRRDRQQRFSFEPHRVDHSKNPYEHETESEVVTTPITPSFNLVASPWMSSPSMPLASPPHPPSPSPPREPSPSPPREPSPSPPRTRSPSPSAPPLPSPPASSPSPPPSPPSPPPPPPPSLPPGAVPHIRHHSLVRTWRMPSGPIYSPSGSEEPPSFISEISFEQADEEEDIKPFGTWMVPPSPFPDGEISVFSSGELSRFPSSYYVPPSPLPIVPSSEEREDSFESGGFPGSPVASTYMPSTNATTPTRSSPSRSSPNRPSALVHRTQKSKSFRSFNSPNRATPPISRSATYHNTFPSTSSFSSNLTTSPSISPSRFSLTGFAGALGSYVFPLSRSGSSLLASPAGPCGILPPIEDDGSVSGQWVLKQHNPYSDSLSLEPELWSIPRSSSERTLDRSLSSASVRSLVPSEPGKDVGRARSGSLMKRPMAYVDPKNQPKPWASPLGKIDFRNSVCAECAGHVYEL